MQKLLSRAKVKETDLIGVLTFTGRSPVAERDRSSIAPLSNSFDHMEMKGKPIAERAADSICDSLGCGGSRPL
ncbi:hypothetical protein GWI33_003962 [Rhynchophorus ferrugineus]|uniref:Uncharacterized protein n=1 Tax=Rhynchophorus ferrugineus TaxID=354439 RepID=A0A834LXQ1_RHYFE|nr:hypothetical protein GWI33_003963 [Rhynchophorus ferrugineus]KAF7262858.1 hypothetical protein GWI33_003962 [Rhynchophorus ferrugineus]